MSTPQASLEAGQPLGHYRILHSLGEGGMGEVYAAEDTKLGRRVAIKVLPPSVAEDPGRLARFEREARAVAALNHPNIVTIFAVEQADDRRFISMELVEGESLAAIIARGGVTLRRFFDLAIPLADALNTAHERGIVHRDLKPANILVTADGRPKILDFGLAKLGSAEDSIPAPEAGMTLTLAGHVLGTVPYMSPEQVQGKDLDGRSDIFSLGVIFYELLTGRRPFGGETSADVISSILRDAPPSLGELKVDLPFHLGRIVKRTLEKRADRRYQTALDLRNEIEDLRREVETGVSEVTGVRPAAVAPPRRWLRILAAGAVLIALVAAGIWLWRRPVEEEEATPLLTARPALVLLPIQNIGEAANAYFADGLTEEMVSQLTALDGLPILAGWTVERALQAGETFGPESGAGWLLQGSVRWQPRGTGAPTARMSFQLVSVVDDKLVWSEAFDRVVDDPLAVQSEVSQTVASRIALKLLRRAPAQASAEPSLQAEPAAARVERRAGPVPPDGEDDRGGASPATATTGPEATAAAEVAETTPDGEASAPTASASIDLHVRFHSDLPRGTVIVLTDQQEILRRNFEYVEKTGLFRSRARSGGFQATASVPRTTTSLRIYVTPQGEASRFVELTPTWPDGDTATLEIQLTADGAATARITGP